MPLSKKNDWSRRFRALKRHTLLLVPPVLIAMITTLIWYWAHIHGHYFDRADDSYVICAIGVLLIPFGIIAGYVLLRVWKKFDKVMKCAFEKDLRKFLPLRDDRMPIMIHLCLAMTSLPILFLSMALDYNEISCGAAIVFSVSLGFSTLWMVATELDNPSKSPWLAERVPAQWFTIDIDEYFKFGQTEKEAPAKVMATPGFRH